MSELADYGTDLLEINRVIRRLAPFCGVDLADVGRVAELLTDTNLPTGTIRDRTLVTLRGLMFLRWKVLKEIQH